MRQDLQNTSYGSEISGAGLGRDLGVPRAVLDPDRRAQKAERIANPILQEALIGEVQLDGTIGEQYKRRWRNRGLRHVKDLHSLAHGNRRPIEIDALEKSIHLGSADTLAAFVGDSFEE